MTRRHDDLLQPTDARFKPHDRGRFGDNEHAPIRGNDSVRSNLVDLKLTYICESKSKLAIGCCEIGATAGPPIYLPKSQIEYDPRNPKNGQTIEVTCPRWLAKEKGLT